MPTLVARTTVTLTTAQPVLTSPQIAIDPLTADITIRLRRPTTLNPLAWTAAQRVKVELVQVIDGQKLICSGFFTGGIRLGRDGFEVPECVKRFGLTRQLRVDASHQPFMLGDGKTYITATRIGETAKTECAAFVRLTLVKGAKVTLDISADVTTAAAPVWEYHNSVAFDAATDGGEQGGDGIITVIHTPVGSSNLAAFVGAGNSASGGGHPGSTTYDGVSMTELWDLLESTFYQGAGYALAGIPTGAKNVVNTITGGLPDEHMCGVVTMTGVHQTTPVGTAVTQQGSGVDASVTVGSIGADDLVVDSLYVDNSTLTIGADQTERNTESILTVWFKNSTQPGTAGGVMSWTGVAGGFIYGAVAFKPAAAGGTPSASFPFCLMGVN